MPGCKFSVSATTRSPRSGEKDGIDYHFLTESDFKQKIKDDLFAEWEEVYPGRFYGTLKSEIKKNLDKGDSVAIDIDVVGGSQPQKGIW